MQSRPPPDEVNMRFFSLVGIAFLFIRQISFQRCGLRIPGKARSHGFSTSVGCSGAYNFPLIAEIKSINMEPQDVALAGPRSCRNVAK
jgi:hypothetical protein